MGSASTEGSPLDDARRIDWAARACARAADFRFLGACARVAADEPEVLDLFAAMYAHFHAADAASPLLFQVVTRPPEGPPYVLYAGRVQPLMESALTVSHAYMYVLNQVLAAVSEVYMLHAGTVAGPRGAMLFLGGPGFGKTTLVLALLARGHALYSDEFACLDRATGLVRPFPRALGLRETAFALFPALAGRPMARVKSLGRGVKFLLDPLEVPGARIAKPAPISDVFVLSSGEEDEEADARIDVAFRSGRDEWHPRLAALPGVALESEAGMEGYRLLRYRVPAAATGAFTDLCAEADHAILYHERVYGKRPDFARAPQLAPVRKSDVATLLLRGLRNREGCFGSHEGFRRQAARAYMDLVRRIKPARCHRLVVGDLAATVGLVEGGGD